VLLVGHGVSGEAQWMAADRYEPWEAFTVVQWDQRGAGHTSGCYGTQMPNVSVDRIAKDGIEVADHLCRTLREKKIIVLGHSWGRESPARSKQRRPLAVQHQAKNVVAGCSGERAVERDKAPAVPARQAEEVAIRDLLAGMCAPHFGHGGRRQSIRPEFVGPAGGSEQEQPVGSRLRNPRTSRQLGTNTDDTQFGNAARRPTLV